MTSETTGWLSLSQSFNFLYSTLCWNSMVGNPNGVFCVCVPFFLIVVVVVCTIMDMYIKGSSRSCNHHPFAKLQSLRTRVWLSLADSRIFKKYRLKTHECLVLSLLHFLTASPPSPYGRSSPSNRPSHQCYHSPIFFFLDILVCFYFYLLLQPPSFLHRFHLHRVSHFFDCPIPNIVTQYILRFPLHFSWKKIHSTLSVPSRVNIVLHSVNRTISNDCIRFFFALEFVQ